MKEHWERVYTTREASSLGWYEKAPECSLKLLEKCGLEHGDPIIDIGAGESVLVDHLLEKGFTNVIVADISDAALSKVRERLGEEKAAFVKFVADDITQPTTMRNLNGVALWHDRALLHFLTEESQRNMYLQTLKYVLRTGGYVIIGAFSLTGAKKCSGLDLKNYDQNMLADFLGDDFELIEYFDHAHIMPSGDPRPYVYALFRKKI